MKSPVWITTWLLAWFAAAISPAVEGEPAPRFSQDAFWRHVAFLGDDALEGRGCGSEGARKAAEYIAEQLKRTGLRGATQSGFFQNVLMHGSIPLPDSTLEVAAQDHKCLGSFALGDDYLLYHGGVQTLIPQYLPLIFVGYGIVAPEFDYNDYLQVDVSGKIVIFLSGEPISDDPSFFDGDTNTIYADAESKQRLAIARGARGSILIPSPHQPFAKPWNTWRQDFAFEDVRLAYESSNHLNLVMNPMSGHTLFADAPHSLAEVFAMEARGTVTSFDTGRTMRFHGHFQERDFIDRNVLAILPGSHRKLKQTCLVLSAHYDHLGIGPEIRGDRIYNGVMDNAVGVAALLELARAFALQPKAPLRSIVFLFTTGEEKGLLGATYYVENPVFPLYQTVANINIDGLAASDTFDDVFAFGASYSTLKPMLTGILDDLDLRLADLPVFIAQAESFARSDQMAFARVGIPATILIDGFHHRHQSPDAALAQWVGWQNQLYHTPFDDLEQPINREACVQHIGVLFSVARALADAKREPEWYPGSPFARARLLSRAEQR